MLNRVRHYIYRKNSEETCACGDVFWSILISYTFYSTSFHLMKKIKKHCTPMQRQLDGWQTVFLPKKKNHIYYFYIFRLF
jgi:hypothetical protein